MKKNKILNLLLFLIFIMAIIMQDKGLTFGSSTNYKIVAEVLDAGGIKGSSTTYKLIGKIRDHGVSVVSSAALKIGEGFLRSSYFSQAIFAPIITSVDPVSASNDKAVALTISGANFLDGATVKLTLSGETDVAATNVVAVNSSKITCLLDITNAKLGAWDITVTNSNGLSGTLPQSFKITYLAPTILSIFPEKGETNNFVDVSISGSYFRSGAQVKLVKTGETDIAGESVIVESLSKITCRFNLNGKPVGIWDVVVINDDNQSGTLSSSFKIESPNLEITKPVVSLKNPFDPTTGATTIQYSLSKDFEITVYIFNMRGERVWQFKAPAGTEGGKVGVNQIMWDGITNFSSFASIGVYFVHVTSISDASIKTLGKTKIAVIR